MSAQYPALYHCASIFAMERVESIKPDEARAYASECRAMAQKAVDSADRLMLLTMADAWDIVARSHAA